MIRPEQEHVLFELINLDEKPDFAELGRQVCAQIYNVAGSLPHPTDRAKFLHGFREEIIAMDGDELADMINLYAS